MQLMKKYDNSLLLNIQAYYIEDIMRQSGVTEESARLLFLESLQQENIEYNIFDYAADNAE